MMLRATRPCLRGFRDVLPRTTANFAPLTPIQWIDRAAETFPTHEAVRHRPATDENVIVSRDWITTRNRAVSLASTLDREMGCGGESTNSMNGERQVVQVMLGNVPEMFEVHYGVPMSGAVLGCINTRLDASTVAYILGHSEARAFIYDPVTHGSVVHEAVKMLPPEERPLLIQTGTAGVADLPDSEHLGTPVESYESLLSAGNSDYSWHRPKDEYDAIALNYTSGTTGRPKGCVLHHRGAYLTAMGNTLSFGGMSSQNATRYLWTLPMFHCNGWNFPYTVALVGGTNICLDKVDAEGIRRGIVEDGATHFCGAPIVLQMAIKACCELDESTKKEQKIKMMVAAAPPPAAVLRAAESAGIDVTHVYGLTEVYGPATVCEWKEEWNTLNDEEQASVKSRQGVRYGTLEELIVLDRVTGQPTPADSETMGEVAMRGNMVFKGYHKNEEETLKALRNGYFHTGDLGVRCDDGYVALKDREKDIIISGGENISSIEVENTLCAHNSVASAAVVAMPHEKWQEVGCAFIETTETVEDHAKFESEMIDWCKTRMARFQAPHKIVVGPLPKTSTGKIQKFVLRKRAKEIN